MDGSRGLEVDGSRGLEVDPGGGGVRGGSRG